MNKIISLFSKGVLAEHTSIEAKRIVITNVTIALCIFLSIGFGVIFSITGIYPLNIVFLFFAALHLFNWQLSTTGNSTAAKVLLYSCMLGQVLAMSINLGVHADVKVFYIPIAIIPFLIFGKKEKRLLYASILLTAINIGLIYTTQNYYSPIYVYSEAAYQAINSAFNLTSIFCMMLLSFLFLQLTESGEIESVRLMKELDQQKKITDQSNIELKKSTAELERLNILKDHLFRILSHDLRSPINNIHTLTELMMKDQLSKEDTRFLAERFRQTADDTNYLLDNLLNWSNLQIHQSDPEETFFLHGIIERVFEQVSVKAAQKNVRLVNKVSNTLLVRSDPGMIEIVIRNLVSNAIKFSYPDQPVSVEVLKLNDRLVMRVEDHGIGIPKEMQEKLFTTDKTISREGTRREKGTGIGLLLCKQLIDKKSGRISVTSIPGIHTVFTVEIATSRDSVSTPSASV